MCTTHSRRSAASGSAGPSAGAVGRKVWPGRGEGRQPVSPVPGTFESPSPEGEGISAPRRLKPTITAHVPEPEEVRPCGLLKASPKGEGFHPSQRETLSFSEQFRHLSRRRDNLRFSEEFPRVVAAPAPPPTGVSLLFAILASVCPTAIWVWEASSPHPHWPVLRALQGHASVVVCKSSHLGYLPLLRPVSIAAPMLTRTVSSHPLRTRQSMWQLGRLN